jgi:hypothetical protein
VTEARPLRRRRPLSGLALWAFFCAPAALARVEVQVVEQAPAGSILQVRVSEEIAPGDYEALLQGVLANPGSHAQKILLLDSIGGSVPEAIRMGRLLRELGFAAQVPESAVCQGTCVYLLAAGRPRRVLGYVGLHRPYFAHGDSVRSELSARGQRYSPAAYFREMQIPARLLQDMQKIAPARMQVLSSEQLEAYGLQ